MEFKKSIQNRRSYYGISKESSISDDEISNIVKEATKHVPSAFHSQSQNTVLLFGKSHDKLWDITMESLRKVVPAENFSVTERKINSFKAGYGTVLYFVDDHIIQGLQEKFPAYANSFPRWAEQEIGMLQFAIWSMLEEEGLGVSLQHYNPLIDQEVKEAFPVPSTWRLIAQMPFGKPTEQPGEKEFMPIDKRVKIYS